MLLHNLSFCWNLSERKVLDPCAEESSRIQSKEFSVVVGLAPDEFPPQNPSQPEHS